MRSPLSPLIPYILMNILTLHRAKVNTMRGRRGRNKKIVNFTACRETRHAVRGRCGFSGYAASPALPGCGARIARCSACALRPLPLLRLAASAAGGARLCSSLSFPTITKKCVLMPNGDSNALFALKVFQAVGACPPLEMDLKSLFRQLGAAVCSGPLFVYKK